MALLSAFIGINKHADPRIRELTGARWDAVALWALFSDTIPDISAELLTDEAATVVEIRRVLDTTLGAAGPNDTVVLFFAGHGTHDHRLVAYNTSVNALEDSTIAMGELAARFKQTQAKAVLCILDCCFSGGAPARVLEDSPIPRDLGTPLESLAGKGRILIAASNIDQSAYELPTSRHGILTSALLDILQAGDGTVNLSEATALVLDKVRAEAGRLGVEQTPVSLGYIEGGLTLPTLRRGKRFFAAFPELQGVRISNIIQNLKQFGLPQEVLDAWSKQFANGLNNLQLDAVNEHRILDGASLLVVAPTSSGKTFIGEMAAVRAIIDGRKAVFLLPYRALVNEKFDQFSSLYGASLGMRIIRCTGDYLDQTGVFVRGKYDLALLTYEMFLNLALGNPTVLNQIGLVVLDEAQFITDPTRGITVELLLTYLLAARARGVSPQLIALSAVIGDVNSFDAWLDCRTLVTNQRPVPLVEGVLDRSGVFQYLDPSGTIQTSQLLPAYDIQVRRDKPSMQDIIVPLVRSLVSNNEKVIVFRNQKGKAEGCARYLAADLGLPPATLSVEDLPAHDLPTTSADLRFCLNGGTAFHNTNLTREEKTIVEQTFRDPNSPVRILAATTTVAAGINTPASTVILAEQEFIGEDGRQFTVAEYKNMSGRAGRLGFNEQGKSIILANTLHEREVLFHRYVMGQLEPLRSSFDPNDTETWVVRLLAQIGQVARADVIRLLANTYGGYVALQKHPEWRQEMEQRLEQLLVHMIELGLVEQEGELVNLTLLGRACGQSALSFSSALRLVDLLRNTPAETLTAENLLALLQILPEADSSYTPVMKRGQGEAVRVREAAERYGSEVTRALQSNARDNFEYYARCKRAAILWDWVRGTAVEEIEKRYSTTPFQGKIGHGEVRRFADNTRFHLRSAHQVVTLVLVGKGPGEEAIETLLKQLETGIPADGLELLNLPVALSRGEHLALYQAGIRSMNSLWDAPRDTLERILSSRRVVELELHRKSRPSSQAATTPKLLDV